jgi:hypothetical protein
MIDLILSNLGKTEVLVILAALIGGYYELRVRSLKRQSAKAKEKSYALESELNLKILKDTVERAKKDSESARKNYRNPIDS